MKKAPFIFRFGHFLDVLGTNDWEIYSSWKSSGKSETCDGYGIWTVRSFCFDIRFSSFVMIVKRGAFDCFERDEFITFYRSFSNKDRETKELFFPLFLLFVLLSLKLLRLSGIRIDSLLLQKNRSQSMSSDIEILLLAWLQSSSRSNNSFKRFKSTDFLK
jgi:hypothetical protein